jgi:hypothetical protein
MSFSDYSTTPASNTSIAGLNVAEGCPPGNMNGAVRQLMADGKELANTVGGLSSAMPVTGGAFTGNITRQGNGGYRYNASSSLTSGLEYFLPEGSSLPTPAEGVVVNFYA